MLGILLLIVFPMFPFRILNQFLFILLYPNYCTVLKSQFNEVRQKYLDFCHIYTDGSKVDTKVASAYVWPYGTRGYRLRDGCSAFTAEVEAINKALTYVKVSTRKNSIIFSEGMSV